MKLYSVIKMDLVNSRTIENRSEVQELLTQYLYELSQKYIDQLVTPITISLGDDWIIVLKNCELSYTLYLEINHFLKQHGLSAYAGIGIGSIETNESHDVRDMHGSAFILADKNLKIAKANKYNYQKDIPTTACRVYLSGLPAASASSDFSFDYMVNALIQNNELLLSKITLLQDEVIGLYETYESYQEIIDIFPHMTKRKLSDALKKSNYWLMKENVRSIQKLICAYTTL